jgi:alkyl sulfatase BDS1-like metallo-beta-lactamase superfamily hydrolase
LPVYSRHMTADRADRETTLKDALKAGSVKITGSEGKLDEMLSYLDSFEFWFPIVTP